MKPRAWWLPFSVPILLIGTPLRAQTLPAVTDLTIADFEPDSAAPVLTKNVTVERISGEANTPHGKGYLRITPTTADAHAAYVRIPLPAHGGLGIVDYEGMSASARVPEAAGIDQIEMRWMALDDHGRPIFQRRFTLAPGEKWIRLDEPLRTWRWDERFVGDWDEVRELVLRVDSPGAAVKRIEVDDIRLAGPARPEDRAKWLIEIAFEGRPARSVLDHGMLVATDATEAFGNSELSRSLQDMANVRAFIRRVFGSAARPTDHDGPLALLIFSDDASLQSFFKRMGEQWRAEIAPPTAQGYTVQDIATSTYRKELGTRRPVYLHESVHAIVARDLRLLTGNPAHTPLQEGLANYVQLCIYPQSLNRDDYVRNFARPIDETGAGFFKPLNKLFGERVTSKQYAQLAGVVAYLVEKDPDLLRDLARRLADGGTASDALAARGMPWETFQKAWLAWGRERFSNKPNAPAAMFEIPAELRSSVSN